MRQSRGPDAIDADLVRSAAVTYLEGYLFDPPHAQQAFLRAAELAHSAGRKVALSLSDAFCVHRHRAAFRDLVANHVDILFANETEITALYETNTWAEAAAHAATDVKIAVLTRGADGSTVLSGYERVDMLALATEVVDTTGAGDAYAAGFLAAHTAGRSLAEAGALGSAASSLAIAQYGARPQREKIRRLITGV